MAGTTTLLNEIVGHIQKIDTMFVRWYVGIASDVEARLFEDHRVDRNGDWIYGRCADHETARQIERALLQLGCTGGPGGGDASTIYVYAYRKTPSTIQ